MGLSAGNSVDTHVTVISDQEICFMLRRKTDAGKMEPVTGMEIKVKDIVSSSANEITYVSDGDGLVTIPTNKFVTDIYDVIHVKLSVDGQSRGYRSLYIEDLDLNLGEIYDIVMVPLDTPANGKTLPNAKTPYLVTAQLGKKDILRTDYQMIYSLANDHDFEIKVEVADAEGYPDLVMNYYEYEGAMMFGRLVKRTANATSHEGNVYIFKGPWKQKFAPSATKEQRPSFSFGTADDAVTYPSTLVSVKGATDKPLNEGTGAGGGVFANVLGKGLSLGFDIPLGGDHKLHVGVDLPFTDYLPKLNIDPGGFVTMYIGSDVFTDKMKGTTVNWQSKDQKEYTRQQEKIEKTNGFATKMAKFDAAYDYYMQKGWKFLGASEMKFGIFGVVTARWALDNDDPDVKTKLITARGGAGFTATYSYSWTIEYTVGPFPLYVCFTLGVTAGFALETEIEFCWVNDSFQNWKFHFIRDLTISIGFSFSAQLGMGIKGFLDVYVKFAACLNILIKVNLDGTEPASLTVTWAATLTVGATLIFVNVNKTWNLGSGTLFPKANLLEHYMNGALAAGAVERAHGQEPFSYPSLIPKAKTLMENKKEITNVKLLTVGENAYAFYIHKEFKGPSRVYWMNLNTGKQQSFQEALDLYDREGEDFWYWYSAKDRYDYAFDVREVDGMVALVVCHTSGFDDDGYPMRMTNPHDRESFEGMEQGLVFSLLEPQADGTLSGRFSKAMHEYIGRDAGRRQNNQFVLCAMTWGDHNWKNAYDSMTDPVITDVKILWTEKENVFNGVELRGTMSRIPYPGDEDTSGVTFFGYSKKFEPERIQLHTDQKGVMGAYQGFTRSQLLCPLRSGYEDGYWYHADVHGAEDFIALNLPEQGGPDDAFIELYDRRMNDAGDKSDLKGIKLAEGDIRYMAMLPTEDDGITRLFYTQAEANGDGARQTRLYGMQIQPTQESGDKALEISATRFDYDATIPADRFNIGYIGKGTYFYWWNAVPKDGNADETVWRVWAAAYDPVANVVASPNVLAEFEVSKVWLIVDVQIAPGYLKPVYGWVDMVPIDIQLTTSGVGYLICASAQPDYYERQPRISAFSFQEQLTPEMELDYAIPQAMAVKAGDFEDINIGGMNTGNLTLATFDVELVTVDDQGNESGVVERAHIDLYDPDKSRVVIPGTADYPETVISEGKQAANRTEDYSYSPRQRNFVVTREDWKYDVSLRGGVEVTDAARTGSDSKHLNSQLLMPGSLGDFMTTFKIPDDWKGKVNLRLRVSRVSVESNWLRLVANAAGIQSNGADGNDSTELVYERNPKTGKLELQMPKAAGNAVKSAVASGIIAGEVDAGDGVDMSVNVQDIDIRHRVYTDFDGEDWLSITVLNHAATGDELKLVCAVYVDGAEEPGYINLPYNQSATSSRKTHTISLPVSGLVDDPALHRSARVVVTAMGVDECAYANNEFTVYLGGGDELRFVRQPQDVTVQEGEDVSFSVGVAGGAKPYQYRWQVWNPGKKKWVDLKGFTDAAITREKIEKKWDGAVFRCVVTDAKGTKIVSEEAKLTVRDRIPTGDNSNLPLYLLVAIIALAALVLIRRRRRE